MKVLPIPLTDDQHEELRKKAYDLQVSMASLLRNAYFGTYKEKIEAQGATVVRTDHNRNDVGATPTPATTSSKPVITHRPYDICPKHKIYYSSCGD